MYYHGCLEEVLDKVLTEGLKTSYGLSAMLGKDKPSIYLVSTPEEAGRYGDIILQVTVSPEIVTEGYGKDYIVYQDIPPQHISIYGYSEHRKSLGYQMKKELSGRGMRLQRGYQYVKRTKRGSLVAITEREGRAIVEVPNHEDMFDLSNMLNHLGVRFDMRPGISKSAWEGAPIHMRQPRHRFAKFTDPYPGWTVEFDFHELERVLSQSGMFLTPLLLE